MSILILGSSGLLGRSIFNYFTNNHISTYGTYNTNKFTDKNLINFSYQMKGDINKLLDYINTYNIKIIINSIVERDVDICENNWNKTFKMNVSIVEELIYICQNINIKLIQLSTDYIYDGNNPPYSVNSCPNPLQNYGISKLIAEYRIINNIKDYIILRIPVLYSTNQINLCESSPFQVIKLALDLSINNKYVDNYNKRFPTNVDDVSFFLKSILDKNGIFNYSSHLSLTKYEMVKLACDFLCADSNRFIKIDDISYNRPVNTCFKDEYINNHNFFNDVTEVISKYRHDKINNSNSILLIDLDGTILDTDKLHQKCYLDSLQELNINLDLSNYYDLINTNSLDNYLLTKLPKSEYELLKKLKTKKMLSINQVDYIAESNIFLNYLLEKNYNFCIVTNTSRKIVEHYIKLENNLLTKCNFICREDYELPKPNPDCWKTALQKYYNNEKYIIGIENTLSGFNSLNLITNFIYVLKSLPIKYNMDSYFFTDFSQILKYRVDK